MSVSHNKENLGVNGVKVKKEPGESNSGAPTLVDAPSTSTVAAGHVTEEIPVITIDEKPVFGSKRVLGQHLKDYLHKKATVIGEVEYISITGDLIKLVTTDEYRIFVKCGLPIQGFKIGDLVEVTGTLVKRNTINMDILHKFLAIQYLNVEETEKTSKNVLSFDKSLYNEMVEALHNHSEYLIINKAEHFGAENISDENCIPIIDLTTGSNFSDDEEDLTLGLENHVTDDRIVKEEVERRLAEDAEMDAEFTDSPTNGVEGQDK